MRIPRFYYPVAMQLHDNIVLPKATAHHLGNVLRRKVGQPLRVFNHLQQEYLAVITNIQANSISIEVQQLLSIDVEPKTSIDLAISLVKGSKMDWAVQKAVELGVKQITPIIAERSNIRLAEDRMVNKIQHWQSVAISAAEQSGRLAITNVNPVVSLSTFSPSASQVLVLHPTGTHRLASTKLEQSLQLIIGPEGGFSEAELLKMHTSWEIVNLGKRILRAETAVVASIAIIQSSLDEI